jgi:hypothetical protein
MKKSLLLNHLNALPEHITEIVILDPEKNLKGVDADANSGE